MKRIANTQEYDDAAANAEVTTKRKKADVDDDDLTQLQENVPVPTKHPKTEPLNGSDEEDDEDDDDEHFVVVDHDLKLLANMLRSEIETKNIILTMKFTKQLLLKYFTMPLNDGKGGKDGKDGKDGKKNVHLTKSKIHLLSKMFFEIMSDDSINFLDDKFPHHLEIQDLCTKVSRGYGRKSKFDPVKEWLSNPKMDERGQVPEEIQTLIGEGLFKKKTLTTNKTLQVVQWMYEPGAEDAEEMLKLIGEGLFKKKTEKKSNTPPPTPLQKRAGRAKTS